MVGRSRSRRATLDALRNRVTSNMYSTSERFEARRRSVQIDGVHLWQAPPREQTISFSVWFAALSWQLIYEFVEGNTDEEETPPDVEAAAVAMASNADAWTDFAVRIMHSVENAQPPPPVTLQAWRPPPLTPTSMRGVWRMTDTVATWVERDWGVLTALGIPPRFAGPERTIRASLEPNRQLIGFLREQWILASDPAVQLNIAGRAVAPATELHLTGQRMWAPYLLGGEYREALRRPPTLEDLRLGFDPWILTDPSDVLAKQHDPRRRAELTAFWESVGDRNAAARLAAELDAAERRRHIRYRTPKHYHLPPWPAQYMVRYPITFGSRTFVAGDLISVFVTDTRPAQVEVRKSGQLRRRGELLGL